jgi:hypothetical protein
MRIEFGASSLDGELPINLDFLFGMFHYQSQDFMFQLFYGRFDHDPIQAVKAHDVSV